MIRAHFMFSSQCEAPKKIVNRLSCPSLFITDHLDDKSAKLAFIRLGIHCQCKTWLLLFCIQTHSLELCACMRMFCPFFSAPSLVTRLPICGDDDGGGTHTCATILLSADGLSCVAPAHSLSVSADAHRATIYHQIMLKTLFVRDT
jgi:hypothetical protein